MLDQINKKKERKSNREKDYERLKSVNENEREVRKEKNEKRKINLKR